VGWGRRLSVKIGHWVTLGWPDGPKGDLDYLR
jgi:hypothetical protein